MPTVIDSFVLEFGLEPRKFTQGQRDAVDGLRKLEEASMIAGRRVEESGAKISSIFKIVKGGALGFLGAFAGVEAASFINWVGQMDANVGRMARSMDQSVPNLSTWQYALQQVGGTAEDATGALGGLQNAINQVGMGMIGALSPQAFAILNRIGGAGGKSPDQILLGLAKWYDDQVASGHMTRGREATELRFLPGMNQSTINFMLEGEKAMRQHLETAKEIGTATALTAEESAKYVAELNKMDQAFQRLAIVSLPAITWAVEKLTNAMIGVGLLKDSVENETSGQVAPGGYWSTLMQHAREWWSGTGTGAARGDRNNNPGNIKDSAFARSHGAVGADAQGFAIFPNQAAGQQAMADLLRSAYSGLTLQQIAQRWTKGYDPSYLQSMTAATGLPASGVPNLGDPQMLSKVIRGMSQGEGSHLGWQGATGSASVFGFTQGHLSTLGLHNKSGSGTQQHTSNVTIQHLTLNTQASSTEGIARDFVAYTRRVAKAAAANRAYV